MYTFQGECIPHTGGQGQQGSPQIRKRRDSAPIHVRPHPSPTHPCSTLRCHPLCAGNRSIACLSDLCKAQPLKPLSDWCWEWEFIQEVKSWGFIGLRGTHSDGDVQSWDTKKAKQICSPHRLTFPLLECLTHMCAYPSPLLQLSPGVGTKLGLCRVLERNVIPYILVSGALWLATQAYSGHFPVSDVSVLEFPAGGQHDGHFCELADFVNSNTTSPFSAVAAYVPYLQKMVVIAVRYLWCKEDWFKFIIQHH